MDRDEIIRMAHKCGLCSEDGRDSDSVIIAKHLEQFAHLVAAAEREACAQTVASIAGDEQYRWAALAIRERGAPALQRLNKAAEDNGEPL